MHSDGVIERKCVNEILIYKEKGITIQLVLISIIYKQSVHVGKDIMSASLQICYKKQGNVVCITGILKISKETKMDMDV